MHRTLIHQIGRRSPRSFVRRFALAVLLLGLVAGVSHAVVSPIGDVLPFDNPFTPLVDEGLPLPDGNRININLPANAQVEWENNQVIPGYEDIDAGIVVGQKTFGRLDIDGASVLNFQTLVIGDEGDVGGQTRQGTGFVLITGVGPKFNNDPNILPPGVPANFGSTAATARPKDVGFDLYVGRFGVGTLELLGGGRTEIQDVTVVGDQLNSQGTIIVDGFASYLQTGGFAESSGPIGATRQMTIGRLGIGVMTISNGGTVLSEVAQVGVASNDVDATAAVIGGELFFDNDEPEAGGRGTVTVTGPTSKWILGGTLQVGGYHNTGTGTTEIPSGHDVEYDSTVGRGTLNVYDGGQVLIRPAIDADPEEDDLRLVIGRFGRVDLNLGGYISVGSPGQVDGRQDNISLFNDGVISGGGRIDTGRFLNRFFGEMRINAGQKLIVDATSEFENPATDLAPMINWGLIQVNGTPEARAELEFERAPLTPEDPIQPFFNAALVTQPAVGRGVGQITASHATLRFRSGLNNQGKLAFTNGENIIVGPVVNNAATATLPAGEIAIAGNNTTVVFEDHFVNNGIFEIFPNASLALFMNNFTQAALGSSTFTIGARPEGEEVGFVSVLGDILLDGILNVELFAGSSGVFSPMDGDTYQIMAGAETLVGIFSGQNFPLLPTGLDWVVDYDRVAASVALRIVDSTMIVGADFNGDGVIDAADFAIWFANNGINMGATGAQGDADGDGDVDGDDFLIWQSSLPPGAASGAIVGSSQNLQGTVPEPSALLLLAVGGVTGMVLRRRRGR